MSNKPISLYQLMSGSYKCPENQILRKVLARGKFGDVKVWSSHEISWSWMPGRLDTPELASSFFDLIVLGEPKVISVNLVTISAFDEGVFAAPISMTLAHGLIWVQDWDIDARSDKAEILNWLHWMIARVKVNLNYDRYHFTTVSIMAIIVTIDRAINATDKPAFADQIEQLHQQELMNFDPYSYSAETGSRQMH